MSSARSNSPHSEPMAIPNSQNRRRAMSTTSSDGSPASPLQTPVSPLSAFPPKIATSPSATSPIFSYFMSSTSPTKSNTLPFRRPLDAIAGNPPVFEDEEVEDPAPLHGHHRRATTAGWPGGNARAPQASPPSFVQPIPEHAHRGGIMRRLSLSTSFNRPIMPGAAPLDNSPTARPMTPPPSAAGSLPRETGFGTKPSARVGRRATLLGTPEANTRRAPSPMGERMLKGHFDGFN
ncbi:hypothetical protein PENSPDRAFT_587727 [Peniophora sp. CONT]|nr:hypothetical protein PENSPDRAFT_587727 [Peniophora sp. CONT]